MTAAEPPDDLVDAIRKGEAAERARNAAIAAPPRPARRTNANAVDGYVQTAIDGETEALAVLPPNSRRNDQLNTSAFNLGTIVGAGALDRGRAEAVLIDAARACGMHLDTKDGGMSAVHKTLKSGLEAGMAKPRDMSDVGQESVHVDPNAAPWEPGAEKPKPGKKAAHNGGEPDEARTLKLRKLSTVKSTVPMWVWEYGGKGRIQLGTLTMFAGKPSAGKSTAVRWFAARLSKGELEGIWHGHPMKVAVVMAEEQTDAVVVPGLVAAGADLQNIYTPEIRYGDMESSLRIEDIRELQEELLDQGVRALFIDPIMSAFSGKADIYRNNEVRQALDPFKNLAKAINGIVVGVTHLKKGEIRDVLGGMNGSAAFGEVPRAVFGFAPLEAGDHVFEQVKNNAGTRDLKLLYHLPVSYLVADDGQAIELPRFEIKGPTEMSIADISPNDNETTGISVAVEWLKMYLLENQPAPSTQVKRDAKQHGDIGDRMIGRAAGRLGIKIVPRSQPGKPHTTVWHLPDYESLP